MATDDEINQLLRDDLTNDFACLCVAAVTWHAAEICGERTPHQKMIAMNAAILHARALYEFFLGPPPKLDDARAADFSFTPKPTSLYLEYMYSKKPIEAPANKRLFHLVYNRSKHSGGDAKDERTHIKEQALPFARDLLSLTGQFVASLPTKFEESARSIISTALSKSDEVATHTAFLIPYEVELNASPHIRTNT